MNLEKKKLLKHYMGNVTSSGSGRIIIGNSGRIGMIVRYTERNLAEEQSREPET